MQTADAAVPAACSQKSSESSVEYGCGTKGLCAETALLRARAWRWSSSRSRSYSWSRSRCWSDSRCWCRCARHGWLAIEKHILLLNVIDGHPSVRPCSAVTGGYRDLVVVVAPAYIARFRLRWQRTDYVGERHVRQPGHTVVGGLTRKHLVARGVNARGASPASTLVIPDSKHATARAH
jgi:hypothetical protein